MGEGNMLSLILGHIRHLHVTRRFDHHDSCPYFSFLNSMHLSLDILNQKYPILF